MGRRGPRSERPEPLSSATTGVPSAESHVFIDAHWNSADSGTVDFADNGITITQGPRIDDDGFPDYSASWEYRFVADADGVLDFDLQAAFTGNQSDIGTWRSAVPEPGSGR